MYTIEIDYRTGSSLGTHDEKDFIGYAWSSFNKAMQAARVIVEHDKYFTAKDSFSYQRYGAIEPDINEIFEQHGEWFVPVERDDGEIEEINAFWRGYHERLKAATVIESR